jgi:NADP-dependent 3-hydroxy acid dehydrogenase YdfG
MRNNTHPTIVVSGCTKGIGRAICDLFASQGFNVAGFARNDADIAQMKDQYERNFPGQQFLLVSADASVKNDVRQFAENVTNTFGKTDILVNNAGVFLAGTLLEEQDGLLEQLIQTNVYSAYYLTRALLPGMIRHQKGYVFNMCSVASLSAYANGGSYSVSKFALLGFSKQLRMETRHHNIKVTAVMPGATLTDSWAGAGLPDSRFIRSGDVAKTILNIYELSDHTDVEEILIRPQSGDI